MKNLLVILALSFLSLQSTAQRVPLEQVQNYMNTTVTVCGKIYDGVFLESANDSPTLLNMGGPYPNHNLTLLIWGIKLKDFPHKPEVFYINKEVCVTGLVIEYKGKPEIVLETPDQIKLAENTSFGLGQAPTNTAPPATRSSTMTQPADTFRATVPNIPRPNRRPADSVSIPAGVAKQSGTSSVPPAASKPATSTPPPITRSTTTPPAATKPAVPKPSAASPSITTRNQTVTTPASANKPADTTLSKDDVKLTSTVPLRAGPGTNYDLITQVKSGTVVTVLFSANGWSQVLIKNSKDPFSSIGYVRNSMLQ